MFKSESYSSIYITRTECTLDLTAPAVPPWDLRELRFSHRIAPRFDPNHLGITPKHSSYLRARKPLTKQSQTLPQFPPLIIQGPKSQTLESQT